MALIEQGYTYTNLAANGTTVIRTGKGVLHSVTTNKKGAGSNVCAVYDALTATNPIATIDTTGASYGTLFYDVQFNTGLTIVMGTGTAADITVSWTPVSG